MPGINVNQITSMLAKLADPALQQYAAMHRDNPYIVSLAVAESTRRKELRAAGAGQGTMQPQPKVADAAIAEMALPEQQGIGALPAPNMQGMADGGIAGYDDGEAVEMMAGGGMVERYQSGGNIFAQLDQQKASQIAQLNSQLAMVETQLRAAAASGDPQAIQTYAQQAQAIRSQIDAVRETAGNRLGLIESPSAPSAAPSAAPTAPAAPPAPPYGRESVRPPIPPTKAAEDKSGSKTRSAPSAGAVDMSAAGLNKLYESTLKSTQSVDPAATERKELGELMEKGPKEALAEFEKDIAARGDVYKERGERIKTREAGLAKEKEANTNMALLETFLTIAGTRGSLGEAVGAGGRAGLRAYGAGLDKLRAAQEKLEDAKDRMEDLRLHRDDMTSAQRRSLQNAVRGGVVDAKKLAIDGIMARDDVNRKQANVIFDAQVKNILTDKEVAARMATANPQMQIALALGKGNLEDGMRKIAEIQAGKFDIRTSYSDYLKAFAGKETITPPMSLASYAAQFGATLPR